MTLMGQYYQELVGIIHKRTLINAGFFFLRFKWFSMQRITPKGISFNPLWGCTGTLITCKANLTILVT